MFIEILRFIWSFVPSFRSEYFPFKLICPYWFWSRTREAVMAYLEKYWNFTWSFLPFFQIRVFSLQVDLSQLILIKNQGSSHGILIKIKKRSGFLPLFLIRVFSLQVDLSQLILIKKQGSTHGNFIKILKFLGGFLPFFQISGVSDWALDQSHQESGKIYPIFMYTKWLQSITVIISEELCFVSHQYWSYHIVSLLPDHYQKKEQRLQQKNIFPGEEEKKSDY